MTQEEFNFDPQALVPQQETAGPYTSAEEAAQAPVPQQETAGPSTSAPLYAIDPGQREGSTVLHPSGRTSLIQFEDFVAKKKDVDVATESTAHAYRPRDRRELIAAADKRNVRLWAMRSIFTQRALKELELTKSDTNDARAIRHYFLTRRDLFYRLKANPPRLGTINEVNTPRFEVNRRLVALRREGYPGYENHIEATIDVAARVALEFRLSMRSFKRLLGFHGNGYPNVARSNRNKHGAGKKPELRKEKMAAIRRAALLYYQNLRAQAHLPQQETAGPYTSAPENNLDRS